MFNYFYGEVLTILTSGVFGLPPFKIGNLVIRSLATLFLSAGVGCRLYTNIACTVAFATSLMVVIVNLPLFSSSMVDDWNVGSLKGLGKSASSVMSTIACKNYFQHG